MRAVNEIGIGDDVKIFGGGMVGLQFAPIMANLGSLLNGVVNYNTWVPEPSMYFDGTKTFFETYTKRAEEAKVDPLGYYLPPFNYAQGQMIEQAVNATKIARPEGAGEIPAGKRAQDHRRADRVRRMASARKPRRCRRSSAASSTRTSSSSDSPASR